MSDMVWLHAIYCPCEQCERMRGDATDEDESEVFRGKPPRAKLALDAEKV